MIQLDDKRIQNLVYSDTCSGTVVLDQSNTGVIDQPFGQTMSDATAQKFIPTSKCLASIEIRLMTPDLLSAQDVVVEIKKDSGGFPLGNPQDSNYLGRYTIPYTELTTSFKTFSIPLNVELQDDDLVNGVWIVITIYIYDPNAIDMTIFLEMIRSLSGSGLAVKYGKDAWRTVGGMLYFKTFKQTSLTTTTTTTPSTDKTGGGNSIVYIGLVAAGLFVLYYITKPKEKK